MVLRGLPTSYGNTPTGVQDGVVCNQVGNNHNTKVSIHL